MSGRDAAARLVELAAATLPVGIRARRLEEWQSDLRDAESAGVSRMAIARGALRAALTTPRDAAAWGIDDAALAGRRMRWAAALFAAALVLVAGLWLGGVSIGRAPWIVTLVLVSALGAAAAGLTLFGRAIHGRSSGIGAGPRTALAFGLPPITVLLAGGVLLFAGGGVMLVMIGGLLGGIGVAAAAWWWPTDPDPRRRRTRPGIPGRLGARATALLAAGVVAGAVLVAAAHILVWDPLAKLPGLTIEQVYAGMRAAGESPERAVGFVAVWALSWVPLVVGYLLVAVFGARGRLARLDARRIARSALLALSVIGFGSWVAGFSMGMGVADAFMTTGGDTAWTGKAIILAATACGVAAALRILPPPRLVGPEPIQP